MAATERPSRKSATTAIRRAFNDFEFQKAPEPNWWIFERPTLGDAKERFVVTIGLVGGTVRYVPKTGLWYDTVAKLNAHVWEDQSLSAWHMPAGIERRLAEFASHNGALWHVTANDELDAAIENIRCVFRTKAHPYFDRYLAIESTCDWFDLDTVDAQKSASEIDFAVFNVAAGRLRRAAEIAAICKEKNASLPPVSNTRTVRARRAYAAACERLINLSH